RLRMRSVRQALGVRQPDVSARPGHTGPHASAVRAPAPEQREILRLAIRPGLAPRDASVAGAPVRRTGAPGGAASLASRAPGRVRDGDADADPHGRARVLSQLQMGLFTALRRTGTGA